MEQEDAEGRVALLELDLKQRNEAIKALEAETEYERRLIDQYALEKDDTAKEAEDRAFAQEQWELSIEHVDTNLSLLDAMKVEANAIAADRDW